MPLIYFYLKSLTKNQDCKELILVGEKQRHQFYKEKLEHEGKKEECLGGLCAQILAYLFMLKVSLLRTLCFPSGKLSTLRQSLWAAILSQEIS